MEAVERLFPPEFRNRLDAIVTFNSLTAKVMLYVVDKFIDELQDQLRVKKVVLELSKSAKEWLGKKGYSVDYGARPLARVIQTEIKDQLSDAILFGELIKGGKVTINCVDDKLVQSYESD